MLTNHACGTLVKMSMEQRQSVLNSTTRLAGSAYMAPKLSTAFKLLVSSRWTRSACLLMVSCRKSTSQNQSQSLSQRKRKRRKKKMAKKMTQQRIQSNLQPMTKALRLIQLATKVPQLMQERRPIKVRRPTMELLLIQAREQMMAKQLVMVHKLMMARQLVMVRKPVMAQRLMMVLRQSMVAQLIVAPPLSQQPNLKTRMKLNLPLSLKTLLNRILHPEQTLILTQTRTQISLLSNQSFQSPSLRT